MYFLLLLENRLGGPDLNRFEGINTLGVANEEDVEQVDYIAVANLTRFKKVLPVI